MPSTRLQQFARQYDSKLHEELGVLPTKIKSLALMLQIDPKGLTKCELIRKIQRQEGSFDCFATATAGACDQTMCLWREDCLERPTESSSSIRRVI